MIRIGVLTLCCTITLAGAGQTPAPQPVQPTTRPPEDNDQTLRPLTPEEVPPNLNFYAIDPLYRPGVPLGWAEKRIEELLDRGMIARPVEPGRIYLGWRLLRSDPSDVAFNVYRAAGGGPALRLNPEPIRTTTDFVDTRAPQEGEASWWVRPVVNGRELPESEHTTLPAAAPPQRFKAISVRDDVRSVDRIAIADLNGDGSYDFVVKHPAGNIDPGRIRPSPHTYKIDG